MKKNYNQPEVRAAQIILESIVLAGSSATPITGDQMPISDTGTSDQW